MGLTDQDKITYLANCIALAHADLKLTPRELAAIDEIRDRLPARKHLLDAANRLVEAGGYVPAPLRSFAHNVCNFYDMLYLCFVDGDLASEERTLALAFCRRIGLHQKQLSRMAREAIARVDAASLAVNCPTCGTHVPAEFRFCPQCGLSVSRDGRSGFKIPASGHAIEFCQSDAEEFAAAVAFARGAPGFTTGVRESKTWYLAVWPEPALSDVLKLAQLLSSVPKRRFYLDGKEIPWGEAFGFVPCAMERETASRPEAYCFGREDQRINPWGCKQVLMDWHEGADWFRYGEFIPTEAAGAHAWRFDKQRIREELQAALHRHRYCPHVRPHLIDAVLRALPDQVVASQAGPWRYSEVDEQTPGSVRIVEVESTGAYECNDEFYANGVYPGVPELLHEILDKALPEAGVLEVSAPQIIG